MAVKIGWSGSGMVGLCDKLGYPFRNNKQRERALANPSMAWHVVSRNHPLGNDTQRFKTCIDTNNQSRLRWHHSKRSATASTKVASVKSQASSLNRKSGGIVTNGCTEWTNRENGSDQRRSWQEAQINVAGRKPELIPWQGETLGMAYGLGCRHPSSPSFGLADPVKDAANTTTQTNPIDQTQRRTTPMLRVTITLNPETLDINDEHAEAFMNHLAAVVGETLAKQVSTSIHVEVIIDETCPTPLVDGPEWAVSLLPPVEVIRHLWWRDIA
jgi:hypothetical protein